VALELGPGRRVSVCVEHVDDTALVTLTTDSGAAPGAEAERDPATIVCVLDVSFSMDEPAMKDGAVAPQSEGGMMSILDLVKHATRTVVEGLGPRDRLAVVEYSDAATLTQPLTYMDEAGRKATVDKVNALRTTGSTNIWDGIHTALRLVADEPSAHIMLLTDGCPNISPPRGELASLERARAAMGSTATLHTFGFGYNLLSEMLVSLAREGRGGYSFIPDGSFVGTAFVNSLANILCASLSGATLEVAAEGAHVLPVLDAAPESDLAPAPHGGGLKLALPPLRHGQPTHVALKLSSAAGARSLAVTLRARTAAAAAAASTVTATATAGAGSAARVRLAEARSMLALAARAGAESRAPATRIKLAGATRALQALGEPARHLLEDATGQVELALSRDDWHRRWGRHYLYSLARAHALQLCANFKDPGLQLYGGPLFERIRDELEEIFVKLPPPKPSLAALGGGGGGGGGAAPVSMSAYHNSSAPCFAAGDVLLASGATKPIADVRKGDLVRVPRLFADGEEEDAGAARVARVACVVRTRVMGGAMELCHLAGGAVVTPYHPCQLPGRRGWAFPLTLAPLEPTAAAHVTSLLLEEAAPAFVIGGVAAAALGHGLAGPVIGHPFFGTGAVVDNLRELRGWDAGLIELAPGAGVRCPKTSLITRLTQAAPTNPDHHQTLLTV